MLVTLCAAGVVAELVITRAAEGCAGSVIVVGLAGNPYAVGERGGGAGVAQRVPLCARLHDAGPPRLLDQARFLCARHTRRSAQLFTNAIEITVHATKYYHTPLTWIRVVVVVVSLKNEREGALRTNEASVPWQHKQKEERAIESGQH